jgi:hypothetical protein
MREGDFSDLLNFGDVADVAGIERADGSYEGPGIRLDLSGLTPSMLAVGGTFHVECFDRHGRRRWVDSAKNAVTSAGLDSLLSIYFNNGTPIAIFYVGLVDNAGFTSFNAADTLASHGGWAENTSYTGTRQAWGNGASSGQSVTNATPLSFAMTPSIGSPATIRGLLLASHTSSNSSSFLLFSTAAFSQGNQVVNNGDTLKVTYTVAATST